MPHKNSPAAIALATKNFGKALSALNAQRNNVPEFATLMARMDVLAPRLLPANVEAADLQPIFDVAKEVSGIAAAAKRVKSQEAFVRQYEAASAQLDRWGEKMDPVSSKSFEGRMAAVEALDIEKVADFQQYFQLFKEIFTASNAVQNDKIRTLVSKAWKVGKEGAVGRYAVPFASTVAAKLANAWLASEPAAMADHRQFKAWRDAGYELLKGELDHPWGMCSCGKEKLMPWQKVGETTWRQPSPLGFLCRKAKNAEKAENDFYGEDKPAKKAQPKKKGSASKRHTAKNGHGVKKTQDLSAGDGGKNQGNENRKSGKSKKGG